jgi:hypothetical protein
VRLNLEEVWSQVLRKVDDLLQFGLLDMLKKTRIESFQEGILSLKTESQAAYDYFQNKAVLTHLLIISSEIFHEHGLDLKEITISKSNQE